MANESKKVTDSLRATWTAELMAHIANNHDTDVCQIAAGTFMFPTVDANGEDRWIKVSVIIPKEASEENGSDGYALAQDYRMKLEAAEERARKAAEKAAAAKARADARAQKASQEAKAEKI